MLWFIAGDDDFQRAEFRQSVPRPFCHVPRSTPQFTPAFSFRSQVWLHYQLSQSLKSRVARFLSGNAFFANHHDASTRCGVSYLFSRTTTSICDGCISFAEMDSTVRQHINGLKSRIDLLTQQMMDDWRSEDDRKRSQAEIGIAYLALAHYEAAIKEERKLSPPKEIL